MAARQVHPLSPAAAAPGVEHPAAAVAASQPRGERLGLYLHVPFCTRRCHYCSFTTAPAVARDAVERYAATLRREIALLASAPPNRPRVRLETIFLGGGTPSLLGAAEMAAILREVRDHFALEPDAEVTVECNPESVDAGKLAAYRDAGVNRISLGVQSLDDAVLATIGRLHDAAGARRAFDAARAAGFDNVSVDLMYGLPGLDAGGWRRIAGDVLDWEPEHVSAYGLTLDSGSLWGATGVPGLPQEETTVAQFWALAEAAAARGFEHYEISNYARAGFRSRHNQIYWRRGEYLACGTGACGFVGDVRWSNVKAMPRYEGEVHAGRLPVDTAERLTAEQAAGETLILGLRTADGVDAHLLRARAAAFRDAARAVATWRAEGLLVEEGGRARLTEAGFLLSDDLFAALVSA